MELISGALLANITQLSRSLNQFYLENISLQASANEVALVVQLARLNTSFWLTLFIPSMCLILAADITLFIDEEHFKATITVALTANLVMYTLYQNIQEKLPEDSKLKLIDIWLLHGLLMPMVVFVMLVINEIVQQKSMESPSLRSTKVANSIEIESKTKAKYMLERLDKNKTNQMDAGNKMDAGNQMDSGNQMDAGNRMDAGKLKPNSCMFVCKVLVPVTSLIFFITFFIVISVHE